MCLFFDEFAVGLSAVCVYADEVGSWAELPCFQTDFSPLPWVGVCGFDEDASVGGGDGELHVCEVLVGHDAPAVCFALEAYGHGHGLWRFDGDACGYGVGHLEGFQESFVGVDFAISPSVGVVGLCVVACGLLQYGVYHFGCELGACL